MTRHVVLDQDTGDVDELTAEEAAARWERLRIMPCEDCSETYSDVTEEDTVVFHECS